MKYLLTDRRNYILVYTDLRQIMMIFGLTDCQSHNLTDLLGGLIPLEPTKGKRGGKPQRPGLEGDTTGILQY